jgi:hypothetical protein
MKFQKGHKLAKGGLRSPPGGRPTTEEQNAKSEMRAAAMELLTTGMTKAIKKLLHHLDSLNENISIRASESTIEYALRAIELSEIEDRLAAIEKQLEERNP